jgi:hypothetical protein
MDYVYDPSLFIGKVQDFNPFAPDGSDEINPPFFLGEVTSGFGTHNSVSMMTNEQSLHRISSYDETSLETRPIDKGVVDIEFFVDSVDHAVTNDSRQAVAAVDLDSMNIGNNVLVLQNSDNVDEVEIPIKRC